MPQRRTHRKSRYGCDQCKKRRVKCDEKPPRCANCIARDEHCHFSRPPPQLHAQSTPQATPSPYNTSQSVDPGDHASPDFWRSGSESPNDSAPVFWDSIRLRELRLMHHWTTYTYRSAGRQWDRLFKEYIPKEALRADYLMSALLGLTSFHLASEALVEDVQLARQHVAVGLQYQDQGLSGLRNAIANINAENCSPVLFTSILISACVIISPLLPAGTDDTTQSAAEAILPLPEYLSAVEAIKTASLHWLGNTSINMYVDKNFEDAEVERPLFISELRRLNESHAPASEQIIFDKAIAVLEKASLKEAAIASWLVDIGPDFLDELRRGESVALAIYMHWGTLLDQLHHIWWAKFSGKRLVEELSMRLSERGENWLHITTWCRKQVELFIVNQGPMKEQT
ncbi:hypothetical protein K458DRAFT_423662 [Lentithecium fluviatile CBS 122367]|uniref:Zn(2)-C6 fungal-type domain-containing protein n=1 Tax=Lentithecium fluviatile CBS 122367 TaxID=1168545 RepID=A0A6G1IIJ8_9PLEO|nr:hypothetical protein K458DRAFT_423662 [Lentithecium fluviatile CBS 122367]